MAVPSSFSTVTVRSPSAAVEVGVGVGVGVGLDIEESSSARSTVKNAALETMVGDIRPEAVLESRSL